MPVVSPSAGLDLAVIDPNPSVALSAGLLKEPGTEQDEGLRSANGEPLRMLVGALNITDRRTSFRNQGLL